MNRSEAISFLLKNHQLPPGDLRKYEDVLLKRLIQRASCCLLGAQRIQAIQRIRHLLEAVNERLVVDFGCSYLGYHF